MLYRTTISLSRVSGSVEVVLFVGSGKVLHRLLPLCDSRQLELTTHRRRFGNVFWFPAPRALRAPCTLVGASLYTVLRKIG